MTITYFMGEDKAYGNITNRCVNSCRFCFRHSQKGVGGYDLTLEREPTREEIKEDIDRNLDDRVEEFTFCGMGDPLERLDDVEELSRYIKENYNCRIRVVTTGQAYILFPDRDVARELKDSGVDSVSISLNAEDHKKYNHLCRPSYIESEDEEKVYKSILNFANDCVYVNLETELTVLDFQNKLEDKYKPDHNECKKIAKEVGASLRIRTHEGDIIRDL